MTLQPIFPTHPRQRHAALAELQISSLLLFAGNDFHVRLREVSEECMPSSTRSSPSTAALPRITAQALPLATFRQQKAPFHRL